MSHWTGRVTVSIPGNNAFTGIGFQPTWMNLRVSQKNGTTETCNHLCLGSGDGTRSNCSSFYSDATSSTTLDSNTKIISHWERVGGTLTEILAATFVSFDSDGFTLNASTASSNYKVTVELGT